ncbi:MAG: DedA family protein [Candidatus Nanoarchaeia archaeon]|nr:DedA family protein [Candidatus Nanoarchaeia archaeon]
MSLFNGLVEWTKLTFAPLGSLGLFILAFIEASFFPIPPDLLLIILALNDPKNALWFSLICTLGSVLGAIFGYYIGFFGGKPILYKLFKKEKIEKTHALFEKHGGMAIFIAAFTPIPYKVFTIAAGVFYIKLRTVIFASIIGRGMRFFLVGGLIMLFGEPIMSFIDKYFNVLSLVVGVVVIVAGYLYIKKRNSSPKDVKDRQYKDYYY